MSGKASSFVDSRGNSFAVFVVGQAVADSLASCCGAGQAVLIVGEGVLIVGGCVRVRVRVRECVSV